MEAKLTVNGFGFVARYGEKGVEHVLLPLLMRLTELQAERGGRLIAFLAAPPGAGKSTLAAFMEWLSRRTPEATPLQAVGMDGFHYPNAYLDAHSFVDEDGREVGMRSRKGAPQTFDVEGLRAALADARSDAPAPWPTYSRVLHDVVAASLPIRKKILLVEGNYLLLDEGRWTGLAELADYTVFLSAPEALLRERLVARKVAGGSTPEEARAWYEASDGRNVARVLAHHSPADLELALGADGSLTVAWRFWSRARKHFSPARAFAQLARSAFKQLHFRRDENRHAKGPRGLGLGVLMTCCSYWREDLRSGPRRQPW